MKRFRLLTLLCFPLLCLSINVSAQKDSIVGKIFNSKDSSALQGVSVRLQALNEEFTSDENGLIKIPSSSSLTGKKLQLSLVGFANQEITLNGNDFSIFLSPIATDLNEVIVIGYGTSKKKDLTGAVATITSKDFNSGMVSTPEQLIQGKTAGVQITSNGGQPGGGSTIRIRGGASLNSSNDPLIVVDGVPLNMGSIGNVGNPLAMINPNDIESFTVLKDANATAIYGSRASNGVIIITTKKGKSGKPVISFTTTNSVAKAAKLVDVLSADQVKDYVKENGNAQQIAMLGSSNTNWQKEIFRSAFATDNNISIAGALNKWLPYRLSVGFTDQSGILKRDNMKRISSSLNLSPKFFNNHLSVNLNLKGTYTKSFFANQDAIKNAIQFDPTQGVHDASRYVATRFGGYSEWFSDTTSTTLNPNAPRNPVGLLNEKSNIGKATRSIGNLQLDYSFHFLPELHANVNVGYDIAEGKGNIYIPADAAMSYSAIEGQSGELSHSKNKYNNYVVEAYLSYNKDLPTIKSNINAVAGYGYYTNKTTTYNYPVYGANGTTVKTTPTYPTDIQENRLLSYYGRLIYTYDNKYILSGTIRRDGSSKFSKDNRYGVFPSVGFTWRTINENFLKNQNVLSDLKLRLSYGETGQQDGIANYSYQGNYYGGQSTGQYQIGDQFYSYYSPSAYDENLKWESTKTYNAGLDFGFLNNRITGSIDYYFKKTDNLLANVPISVGTNFSNFLLTNVGNMNNHGLELNLNAVLVQTKDLTWNFGYNLSLYNTKVKNLSLNSDPNYMVSVGGITGSTGNYIQRHAVGETPYSFYVYKQVYTNNGQPIQGVYEDLNKDGQTSPADMYFYHSPAPKSTMGFTTSVNYKKWTVSTVIRTSLGNYIYNNVAANMSIRSNVISSSGLINNATTDIYNTNFATPQYMSDYYIQNGSFLRMDNAVIGYNFGQISKTHPDWQLTVSGTVQNVFLITKYKGLDPESNSSNGIDYNLYPRPRTYSLTIGVKF